jgi:hypothetical protein
MVILPLDPSPPPTDELPTLAAVVPTYNRCPYPVADYHLNPLVWCLYSLARQRGSGLRRIVVVDDASTDHTDLVVRHVTDRLTGAGVEIEHLTNRRRANPCHARNRALAAVNCEQVFFTDDDCVFRSNQALATAQRAHLQLAAAGTAVGGLHLPVFLRSDDYQATVKLDRIGKIHAARGEVYANFACYPAEHAHLHADPAVAVVLPIDFLQEVFLADTGLLAEVGGFPDAGFTAVHHEGVFLTLALAGRGRSHFHLLHPDAPLIHFRYGSGHTRTGATGRYPGLQVDDRHVPLATMLAEAAVPRRDTGGRSAPEQIASDVIAGRYAQLLHLDPAGAEAWARLAYDAWVRGRDPRGLFRFPPTQLDPGERADLWAAALEHGRHIHDQQPAGLRPGAHRP